MPKTIVIPVTLDTKGEEARYLKEQIEHKGHKTIVIDAGVLGKPLFRPDISRQQVARGGGRRPRALSPRRPARFSRGCS